MTELNNLKDVINYVFYRKHSHYFTYTLLKVYTHKRNQYVLETNFLDHRRIITLLQDQIEKYVPKKGSIVVTLETSEYKTLYPWLRRVIRYFSPPKQIVTITYSLKNNQPNPENEYAKQKYQIIITAYLKKAIDG